MGFGSRRMKRVEMDASHVKDMRTKMIWKGETAASLASPSRSRLASMRVSSV